MNRALPFGLAFLAIITAATIAITQPAIARAQKEVRTTSMLLAKLMSSLFLSVISEEEIAQVMKEVIAGVDFPMMITDQEGNPRAWKQVGVDPERFTPEELAEPEKLVGNRDYERLLSARDRLRNQNEPFPISAPGAVLGYVYFGQPASLSYLRLLQFILPLLGFLTFIGLLWAARSVYSYQSAAFWASFAKGLAHQMGTPVSSMMGWLELLKRQGPADETVARGLESDLERVRSILRRFSKIGGPPQLQPVPLPKIAEGAIAEARSRFLKDMDVDLVVQGDCQVSGDPELLSWVLEIFLKNAWEARRAEGARAVIRLREEGRDCVLEIEDNGKGIPKDKHRLLFRRSYSTKERGWGVGLLLAKRIIRDIHKGEVRLLVSVPGERTVFAIRLRRVL
ncbi:MAG: HAMP domain-containing sensor histidine kinase [candidate division WOR-3 bacterium]